MEWLNYHHLLYFHTVVREGGLAPAAAALRLRHSTISAQIHALEDALGERLLQRSGRRLVMTELGRVVYRYADEIFALGRELLDTVRGRPTGKPLRFTVGVADAVPKLIVRELLRPAERLEAPVLLGCREGKPEHLLAQLSLHELDLVLTDAPLPPSVSVRAFSHLLGESPVTIFGAPELARRLRPGFPRSLDGAPFLMPGPESSLRRGLEQWLEQRGLRPRVEAEFDDSALLKAFGQDGLGLFAAPHVLEREVCRQYGVRVVGRLAEVSERFYAISLERRLKHPAVVAITAAAREELFAG